MTEQSASSIVRNEQPVVGFLVEENEHETARPSADETLTDAATPTSETEAALRVIGAWSDFDWEKMEAALDRIRHGSRLTTAIADL